MLKCMNFRRSSVVSSSSASGQANDDKVDNCNNRRLSGHDHPLFIPQADVQRIVELFRDQILKKENLSCPVDDAFLLRFLRCRNFDVDRSVQLLLNYYNMRTRDEIMKEVLEEYCLPSVARVLYPHNIVLLSKHRDLQGRPVIVAQGRNWDPNVVSYHQLVALTILIIEELTSDPQIQKSGVRVIVDVGGLTLSQLNHILHLMTLSRLKRIIRFTQGCLPIKLKGIHLVNLPSAIKWFFSIAKRLLSDKLKKRIHSHGSRNDDLLDLGQFVDVQHLPIQLGGSSTSQELMDQPFFETLLIKEDHYKKMLQYGFKF